MNVLRKILFPFSILYGFITSLRNLLFDKDILKSYAFDIPIIAVGNLSVGGTGKTPQIEYLIRLLSQKYIIATLSRGYKRKSAGFILADETSNAEMLGDEPFQFYQKFPQIMVAVDANRKNGIETLLKKKHKPNFILLDDAFQHRTVKAGFYILLTAYGDLYVDDFILPTGNLRESRSGAGRATIIVVTKCPKNISEAEQNQIKKKLNLNSRQQIYFSYIDYDNCIYSNNETLALEAIKSHEKLIIAGIAKPQPFFDYLSNGNDTCLNFPDHHDFTSKDIAEIKEKATGKILITTEKDYVRLHQKIQSVPLFYLPIKSSFVTNGSRFDTTILDYVSKLNNQSL